MPLIDVKNACSCRTRMLQNDTPSLRQRFCKCQHADKATVDKARGSWILNVANEAESAKSIGNVQWRCMKKIQVVWLQVHTGQYYHR